MKWLRVATAAGLVASLARAQRRAGARPCGWHRDGSSGGGSFGQVWPNVNYRATVNDNMLVTVMIETLEGVANAEEIAATHGVDVLLIGNDDLSSFSGRPQNDPRYQDALVKVHDAALKYGKYFGNAGAHYLSGYVLSADSFSGGGYWQTSLIDGEAATCDVWIKSVRGVTYSSHYVHEASSYWGRLLCWCRESGFRWPDRAATPSSGRWPLGSRRLPGSALNLAVPHWLLARSGDTCRPDLHTDSPHQHKCHPA